VLLKALLSGKLIQLALRRFTDELLITHVIDLMFIRDVKEKCYEVDGKIIYSKSAVVKDKKIVFFAFVEPKKSLMMKIWVEK